MMRTVASALPEDHRLSASLVQASEQHTRAGLESVIDPHYAGSHWLGTFANYLVTDRGLASVKGRRKPPAAN